MAGLVSDDENPDVVEDDSVEDWAGLNFFAARDYLAARGMRLDGVADYAGECTEEEPWGETFMVTKNGQVWVSCTHARPHEHLNT